MDTSKYYIPEPYEGNEPYCFVSYAHNDIEAVYPVISALCNAGIRVWYDKGLNVGQEYHERILDRIKKCSCFIVFFSKWAVDINRSVFITNEVDQAKESQKPIYPVYIDELITLPAKLIFIGIPDLQSLILRTSENNSAFVVSELLETLPADCRSTSFKTIPYSEDSIDTSVRRCPVIITIDPPSGEVNPALYTQLEEELCLMDAVLSSNGIAREAIDIAVVSSTNSRPIVYRDITPLPEFNAPSLQNISASSSEDIIKLSADLLDNCLEYYADMGVSSHVPVFVLVSDFHSDPNEYDEFVKLADSGLVSVHFIPTSSSPLQDETVSKFTVAVDAGTGEASLQARFYALNDLILAHLGTTRLAYSASSPIPAEPAAPVQPSFKQRTISRIRKGE